MTRNRDLRLTRRELAEGAAGIAVLGALGAAAGAQKDSDGQPARILPPGAVPPNDFLARCLRCGRCISACHARVVVPAGWGDGLAALRTPKLDFRSGWCDLCGECARVCPTGALLPFEKAQMKVGIAEVTESCIALRTGACRICRDECPEDAISLTSAHAPVVNPDLCNGCGLCELRCPANVFQSYRTGRERGIVVRPLSRKEVR